MKALVGAFNQEKALVGAFSVIVQPVVELMDRFTALAPNKKIVMLEWNQGCRRNIYMSLSTTLSDKNFFPN